jgi:hypothetical protein
MDYKLFEISKAARGNRWRYDTYINAREVKEVILVSTMVIVIGPVTISVNFTPCGSQAVWRGSFWDRKRLQPTCVTSSGAEAVHFPSRVALFMTAHQQEQILADPAHVLCVLWHQSVDDA